MDEDEFIQTNQVELQQSFEDYREGSRIDFSDPDNFWRRREDQGIDIYKDMKREHALDYRQEEREQCDNPDRLKAINSIINNLETNDPDLYDRSYLYEPD